MLLLLMTRRAIALPRSKTIECWQSSASMVVLDQMDPSKTLVAIASGMTFDEKSACIWLLSPLLDYFFLSLTHQFCRATCLSQTIHVHTQCFRSSNPQSNFNDLNSQCAVFGTMSNRSKAALAMYFVLAMRASK